MVERINKSELYDHFARLNQQTQDLVANMKLLQEEVNAVLEENAELSIENEHLQQLVSQQAAKEAASADGGESGKLTPSRENLKKLYQRGFHVCNEYFGKRLEDGESCTFCLDTIYGDHSVGAPKGGGR